MLGVTFHRLGRLSDAAVGARRRNILDDVNYALIAALVICFARTYGFVETYTFSASPRSPPAAALEGLNSK